MGVGAGLYKYDVVIKKFTFVISSPDELFTLLYGVHIGATWRIRLNRPCAAAMRRYVKLL